MSGHARSESAQGSPTFYCRALYDYASTDASSLSFKAGDIIEVLTTLDSGWWDGLLNGDRRGWLPSTFTTPISRDEAERELHSQQFSSSTPAGPARPSVSDTEALVSAFSQADISSSDWLPDEMSFGMGRESFSDMAHSSLESAASQPSSSSHTQTQAQDFWMPQFGDDGQIYYVNSQTGARSREMPSDDYDQTPTSATSRGAANISAATKRSGTPEPWVRRVGDMGVFYYENLVDGSVSWTRPSPQSTPRLEPLKHPHPPELQQPAQPAQQRSLHQDLFDDDDDDLLSPEAAALAPRIHIDDHQRPARPDSFIDPVVSSLSFMDEEDSPEFENETFMNRLSVYSDDSDVQPRSPMRTGFPTHDSPRPELNPQESLTTDARHAEELQDFLAIPEPPTLHQLSETAASAIGSVTHAVSVKSGDALNGHNFNEREESLTAVDDETSRMVIAVRNLLHSFTVARVPPSSAGPDATPKPSELESSIPILQPQQRRVAATLSKMILSKRSYQVQMDWPTDTTLIDSDAREMDSAITTYVRELETEGPPEGRPLHGALVSAPGLAGIGLGSMGAGSAGRWRGGGFIDVLDYPSTELDDTTFVHAQQLQAAVVAALNSLSELVAHGEEPSIIDSQNALLHLTTFSNFALGINVARLDVDGVAGDLPQTSRVDADSYFASVLHSRTLVRSLETALQIIMDDSSTLLLACQSGQSLSEELPKIATSLTSAADVAVQTLRGMVEARKTQKRFVGSRALNGGNLRVPPAHKQQQQLPHVQSLPPITLPSASSSRHPSTSDMNGFAPHFASGAELTSPSMIISPETVTHASDYGGMDGEDEDMVDFDFAFSRDTVRRPNVPSNFDPSAPYYASGLSGSRDSGSPELGENGGSEGFSTHSRNTSQPTTIGSRDGMGVAAAYSDSAYDDMALNESTMELPMKDDEDDEDFASAKSSTRKRGPKIAQFFGDDAPEYMLNQMTKEQPAYLQPDYAATDIIVNPDGSVRGGTLLALVERLTMHDFRDPIYFDSFLQTYKTFTSPEELIDLLIRRYHMQPPENLTQDQVHDWRDKKLNVVRLRVINTLKTMMSESEAVTRTDTEALARIEAFAVEIEPTAAASSANLTNAVSRVRRGEEAIRQPTMYTDMPPPVIPPKNVRKMKLPDIDPLELARQLTIKESRLYCTIRGSECLQRSQEPGANKTDNIKNIIFTSNKLADWVADSVLQHEDHRKRGNVIKLFIMTAERCRALRNYSSMAALIAGLNSPPIRRLKRSWELVNQKLIQTFDSVEKTLDSAHSFQNYKNELQRTHPPCVPFFGVYLTILTFIQDGSPDALKENGLINFAKRTKIAEVIREIKGFQSKQYNLTPVAPILQFIDTAIDGLTSSADDFWNLSLQREPREKDDEKMQRLLTESGFL
ncbi:ras GEF [Auriculariales sp. MPI-PUGE-AT-0066]|nr:ras GEF [Auriculariales sp. MPI-PUGE-AT-0066]